MTKNNIRIGMMSVAHQHAISYIACLKALRDVELVGLWYEDATVAADVAGRFDLPIFDSPEALVRANLDGVVICCENAKHREHVELAAGEVPYILCEKPISTNIDDGKAMIQICQQKGSQLQIAFPVRFHPVFVELKQMLDDNTLGQVLSVECTNHGTAQSGWFIDPEQAGGGAVIDHTVHVIDLLRWFWGEEVTEVYAEVGESLLDPNIGIDDAGLLSFALGNGIYGTLDTSWSRPPSYATWGDVKIEVIADGGVAYADMSRQHINVSSNQVGKSQWHGWGGDMDMGLIQDFVDSIRLQRSPSIPGEDGLQALAVAVAAYRSAKTGMPVQI